MQVTAGQLRKQSGAEPITDGDPYKLLRVLSSPAKSVPGGPSSNCIGSSGVRTKTLTDRLNYRLLISSRRGHRVSGHGCEGDSGRHGVRVSDGHAWKTRVIKAAAMNRTTGTGARRATDDTPVSAATTAAQGRSRRGLPRSDQGCMAHSMDVDGWRLLPTVAGMLRP